MQQAQGAYLIGGGVEIGSQVLHGNHHVNLLGLGGASDVGPRRQPGWPRQHQGRFPGKKPPGLVPSVPSIASIQSSQSRLPEGIPQSGPPVPSPPSLSTLLARQVGLALCGS